ncbi:MAG: DUF3558 family protein [Gordonia sp. (in: high G+C Gram-positive bacteria)]
MATTRVDAWIWAIRLTKTRSAAAAACRAGHVRVNDVTAKPAQQVTIGDRVQLRLHGRERIVEVTKLLNKRVSAPQAADCYLDHSPPPPPREILAAQPRRDRGAGRPTKRERRELDRFRRGTVGLVALAGLVATLVACSSDDASTAATRNTPQAPGAAGAGPFFGECGGLTTAEVIRITTFGNLTNTINNPSVCEWNSGIGRTGAVASFNWYRGSPIGRERGTEQLSRDSVEDIDINGHSGFIAADETICEIAIEFGADFFEWSVSAGRGLAGSVSRSREAICDSARELSRLSIERAT